MEESRVYILLDEESHIIRIEGEYTLPEDLTGWVLIEQGESCDRLNLAQSQYLPYPLLQDDGTWRYKYIDDQIVEVNTDET